jgi:D-3-phosphoglycerate dehydrogenase
VFAKRPNILVAESDGFSPEAAALLRRLGTPVLAELSREELVSAVGDADVLWVRLRHRIDADVMTAARCLKIIVTATTGLNHIDLEEANRRGIKILSLQGETQFLKDIRATAEHTIALTLALLRHVPAAVGHTQSGGWTRQCFKGHELYRKTIGVIGYGRLGRIVARYFKAFDTKILATDPEIDADSVEPEISLVPFRSALRKSDLVTLHVNLCPETKGFFGRQQFAAMKPGAWFINTSRGELVDESALVDALSTGRLTGAAVDVLYDENSTDASIRPLIEYSRRSGNLLITPHIGGCTFESMEKTEMYLADRLVSLLQ